MDQIAGEPIETVSVLQGFDVEWDRRPHRLSRFEVDAAEGRGTMSGGSWADGTHATDLARVDVDTATLSVRGAATGRAEVRVQGSSGIQGRSRVPAVAVGAIPVSLPVGATDAAAFLTGFSVESDPGHPDGFTLGALEIHLDPPARDASGRWTVPYRVEVDGGPVPDRHQGLGAFGADVIVSVVAVPAQQIARRSVQAPLDLGPGVGPRANPLVEVDAPWDPDLGLAALSGFGLDLGDGAFDGRYTRGLAFDVGSVTRADDLAYVPVRLGFDNGGSIDRPVHAVLTAEVTAIPAEGGES